MVGRIYGKVLVRRVKELRKEGVNKEHGSFREGIECVNQVFPLIMIDEKLHEKDEMEYVCFMDLEKAFDRVCRKKIFELLREVWGSGREIIERNQSLF